MKRKLILALAFLLMMVPFVHAQDEPIRIGIVTDLSGGLAIYGVEQVNGFQLGLLHAAGVDTSMYETIDEALAAVTIAGRPVEIIIKDYGSADSTTDPDNAAAATRELIESDFADVILGTPASAAALQVQTLTSPDEYNTVFFAGPAAAANITGASFNVNTFRVCRSNIQDAFVLASQIEEGSSYVVLALDTAFGQSGAQAFEIAFDSVGATKAVDTIFVPADTVDFTPYLQQVLDSEADYVVQIWAGASAITLAQQTVEMGVLEQMELVTGVNSNDLVALAPPPEGTVAYIVYQYTLPDNEINTWMVDNHIKFFSDVPDLFTECAFATAQALVAGLTATEGDATPEMMIPALEGLTWNGPKGEYYIRPSDHQVLAPQYVVRYTGLAEVTLAEGLEPVQMPQYELVAEIDRDTAAPPCMLPETMLERCEMDASE